ncbi:hypothetical protein D9758_000201 [Tetrapyrgos nigripes]|uniref:Transmembrane protein n=1 Tax=Tetrapyrgos nigripes TaxID=182062 RepID=A0A8H5H196_9AGAR|nr:hypothetical protein D9758_000201 [Tetrapyrgos nigripes]
MKPRDYCCCAIPVVNAGIYVTLIEQFVAALAAGILSMATPDIVGAATPSFAPWIFGIVCLVAAAIQVLGFIGVAREKPILFRRYVSLHVLALIAVFAIAAVWVIISASRHNTAKSNCMSDFYDPNDSSLESQADTLCTIFPWIDVGIMGALWVLLGIVHLYLYTVLSAYSTGQQADHAKYDALRDQTIPMNSRNDPWDSRMSTDLLDRGYAHGRHRSATSVSEVMSAPPVEPKDGFYSSTQTPHKGY